MADLTVGAASSSCARAVRSVVFTTKDIGYIFFVDSADSDLKYKKTTDGGATWGTAVTVIVGAVIAFDVWFDKWTTGGTGTLIHVAWAESVTHDVLYRTVDTGSSDALGTQRTVFAGASAVVGLGVFVSLAKMRGGNIYCAFDIDAGAEKGLRRSTDAGVNWTTRDTGTPIEATLDWAMLFPGNAADNQDLWMLYFDASANALTLKAHANTAATTSESATIATIIENVSDGIAQFPFAGAIRHSDGHLIATWITEYDTVNSDHGVADINGTASITQKTAITTNIDDHYWPGIFIDQETDDIYIPYVGKRDGLESITGACSLYYTKSTDGGATWSAGDTAYSQDATLVKRQMWTPHSGDRFIVAWRSVAANEIRTNFVNSLDLSVTVTTRTADLAANDPQDVAAFAAERKHAAALAATDAKDAAAFAAAREHVVSLAASDSKDTAAFASARKHVAQLGVTEARDVAAFDASILVTHQAALGATEYPSDSASFSAVLVRQAALAAVDGRDVAAFAAGVIKTHTADLAATEASDVAAFSATGPAVVATQAAQGGGAGPSAFVAYWRARRRPEAVAAVAKAARAEVALEQARDEQARSDALAELLRAEQEYAAAYGDAPEPAAAAFREEIAARRFEMKRRAALLLLLAA